MPVVMTGPDGTPRGTAWADNIKAAWTAFMEADEVGPSMTAYAKLRKACNIDAKTNGRAAFDTINVLTQQSTTPHRIKELVKKLSQTFRARTDEVALCHGTRVVVSGAGPVGLRAAVEAAMMGMEVWLLEKRETFSRVNILTLWKQTADDLVSFGARAFYPRFSNLANFLHLGTREIQLTLLKNALLLGVHVLYGAELVGMQAPPAGAAGGAASLWCAWVKAKNAEELGLGVEEQEEEYVKAEVGVGGSGGPGAGASEGGVDGEEADEDELLTAAAAFLSPRGTAAGGVAAFAAAFAARAAVQNASTELQKAPRRKIDKGSQLAAAMAVFHAPVAAEPPPLDGLATRGKGTRKGSTITATPSLLGAKMGPGGVAAGGGGGRGGASGGGGGGGTASTEESTEVDESSDLGIGSLEFKPSKAADYFKGAGQGRLNYMQASPLDSTFAIADGADPPTGANTMLPFDALLLAEGEWSRSCTRLGVVKAIDRFSLAIGLVINLQLDPADERTRKKESFHESFHLGPTVGALASVGLQCENLEYLRGETHYIAVTVKKASLLLHRVLLHDRSALEGPPLLARENVSDAALLVVARTIASHVGLPETTPFCAHHPAKLFDFSTRARALAPFKVLAVQRDVAGAAGAAGAAAERVVALDLAAQPYLAEAETAHLARIALETQRELEARRAELETLEGDIKEAAQRARLQAELLAAATGTPATTPANLDEAVHVATIEGQRRRQELQRRVHERQSIADVARDAHARWLDARRAAESAERPVPVLPIGDSLLEPFWPQGLGSNRGFHSALDACFAVRVLRTEGLEAALLDRHFSYDCMICQPFHHAVIEPGPQWRADYLTRYIGTNLWNMILMYDHPSAKRLFKGKGAVPPRVAKMFEAGTLARKRL